MLTTRCRASWYWGYAGYDGESGVSGGADDDDDEVRFALFLEKMGAFRSRSDNLFNSHDDHYSERFEGIDLK
jgi:hypothetical protein